MKILALVQPGTNSRGLLLDMIRGFESAGHAVLRFDLDPIWALHEAMGEKQTLAAAHVGDLVVELMKQNDFEFSLSIGGIGAHALPILKDGHGRLRTTFEMNGLAHVHYWWDAPHWWNQGMELPNLGQGLYAGAHQYHCINNPGTGAEMANLMGFANVIPGPNGVNPELFRPTGGRPEYDLVFVSGGGDPQPTATMLEELEQDDPDVDHIRRDVAGALRPDLDRIAASFEGSIAEPMRGLLDAMVEERLAARHAPALVHVQRAVHADRRLAEAAEALLRDTTRYVESTDTIRRIDKWERPFVVAYLSRHFKCLRLGGQRYDAWGVEGASTGIVEYAQQSAQYARARCALNVMRWQDDVGLNSKIFEITASGSACLQAYRTGVDDLFDTDREIAVFRSPAEARERLADLLAHDDDRDELAAAGRARTLAEHTWRHRAGRILDAIDHGPSAPIARDHADTITCTPPQPRAGAATAATAVTAVTAVTATATATTVPGPATSAAEGTPIAAPNPGVHGDGTNLSFVLCSMRSGSTLLRRILDAHPQVAAPPESWFLLPLLDLWEGSGSESGFDRSQAAAGLRSIADRAAFERSCAAFAAELYTPLLRGGARRIVDKTPRYLAVADQLAGVFPRASFVVLSRDPRGVAWSMHTWKHGGAPIDRTGRYAAEQAHLLATFLGRHGDRSHHVRYEDLCGAPDPTCAALCAFLDVPFHASMLDYGRAATLPGYGDENVLEHERPHDASVDRWRDGMSDDEQEVIARSCGVEALDALGYAELSARAASRCAA